MKPLRSVAPLLALVAACSAPDAGPASDASFEIVADVQQTMLHVLEPAAEHYWDAVGWILDESGETAIRPTTEEEWEHVVGAAYVIAESGNLLMMEGRALDDPAWRPMSQALVDIGQVAIEAAGSRDPQAVFDAGAEVYYVCTNCHATFALQTLRPNDERAR